MNIKIRLFATFRNDRFKEDDRIYPESTVVNSIVTELAIPEDEIGIILINGRHKSLDDTLNDGDTLSIFPKVGGG